MAKPAQTNVSPADCLPKDVSAQKAKVLMRYANGEIRLSEIGPEMDKIQTMPKASKWAKLSAALTLLLTPFLVPYHQDQN